MRVRIIRSGMKIVLKQGLAVGGVRGGRWGGRWLWG